jgi:hypothetical protein
MRDRGRRQVSTHQRSSAIFLANHGAVEYARRDHTPPRDVHFVPKRKEPLANEIPMQRCNTAGRQIGDFGSWPPNPFVQTHLRVHSPTLSSDFPLDVAINAMSLSVLITNIAFCNRSGTEIVVELLARGLQRAGHRPMIFSPSLGAIAKTAPCRARPPPWHG